MKQVLSPRWLLKHDPSERPTSAELLQSELIPPPQMEETEIQDMFRFTLSNPQSKAYKYLMKSCFKQTFSPADEIIYTSMDTSSFSTKSHFKLQPFIQRVKDIMTSVFRVNYSLHYLSSDCRRKAEGEGFFIFDVSRHMERSNLSNVRFFFRNPTCIKEVRLQLN